MNSIQFPLQPLFSFAECRWFLDRGYDECLHRVVGEAVEKLLILPGCGPVIIRITGDANSLYITSLNRELTPEQTAAVKSFVSQWFDLSRDLTEFYRQLSVYSPLAYMPETFSGLRLMCIPDLFEALCWCIIGQQINLSFAYRLKRRLVESWGESLEHQGTVYHAFPKTEVVAALKPEVLQALQFSKAKANALIQAAQAFSEGKIRQQELAALPDEEVFNRLTALKGVGGWSANYAMLKTLGRLSRVPYGDSGLNRAIREVLGLAERPTQPQVEAVLANFPGWEGYAVLYLWRSLSAPLFQR